MTVIPKVKHFVFRLMPCIALIILTSPRVKAQYTDVINSNRPGKANSAYALGPGVYQMEIGYSFHKLQNNSNLTESGDDRADLALRVGIFSETLEFLYEGALSEYLYTNTAIPENPIIEEGQFTKHRIGFKLLLYDRYKNAENQKPNLYSWRANNSFKLRNILPSIAIYAGTNYVNQPSSISGSEDLFSTRLMLATQSSLSSRTVLITNFVLDKLGAEFPERSYAISISQNIINPQWSIFAEHQGIRSENYQRQILRGGIAYLWHKNFQIDVNTSTDLANSENGFFIGSGMSYRLDKHKDIKMKSEPAVSQSFGRLSKTERRVKRRVNKRNRKRSRN
jgi:hypothetical protein